MDASADIVTTVDYWNDNARWYRLWVEHTNYHEPILHQLMQCIQPHWRVLDIGAGNGVLSFPLAALGCTVTAIEPSAAMRRLFFENAWRWGIGHVAVDDRPWADFEDDPPESFDLAVACNSLHVCGRDEADAFRRLLSLRPRNIFIVTEKGTDQLLQYAEQRDYDLCWTNTYEMQSPYVYHSLREAYEHRHFRSGLGTACVDERTFFSLLRLRENHWYLDETVTVSLLWWSLCNKV